MFWAESNFSTENASFWYARIVTNPVIVVLNCVRTGLRPKSVNKKLYNFLYLNDIV